MSGRPRVTLEVSDEQREELSRIARSARSQRHVAFRAKLVLACADGASNKVVAQRYRTSEHTVGRWRRRFIAKGVSGLLDEPRPGAPRQVSDDAVAEVVSRTLEETPRASTHWSTRTMAEKVGLSHTTVGRIWRAFGLKPHRTEGFQLSNDPLLIDKVRDVVGLYMHPPVNALVLCVDEKSQIQALSRNQPLLPMQPGQPERHTTNYERHGTTSLFAALDVATGKVIGRCYDRHRTQEFVKFLSVIEANVPSDQEIHLILDNYATHKAPPVKRWLQKRPRFQLHFTPTHSSWLNQVERWFGLLTQRQIKRGSHTSVHQLKKAIDEYIAATNDAPKPFKWTATADDILGRISRFATRTLRAHTEVR